MNNLHIKKDDEVIVLSGKHKGASGKVLAVFPKKEMVIVEGVGVTPHHTKPRKQGETGGIIERETPMRACKVMKLCPKCKKPTKPAHKVENGKKTTVCKKCGAEI